MLEKVKEFFAGIASVTIALYAIGYLAEYANSRMLGITVGGHAPEYYLTSGGTFFPSTLFAIFSTLFSHWYYYIIFSCVIGGYIFFDRYEEKKQSKTLRRLYKVFLSITTLFYLIIVIPRFMIPLRFQDFLLRKFESITWGGPWSNVKNELSTWILNENSVNINNLSGFYVSLLLFTGLSVVMAYTLIKRWKKKKTGKYRTVPVLTVLMITVTAILFIIIPINFGILIKSNTYPEVNVTPVQDVDLLPGKDTQARSTTWLLRENSDEVLLHTIYIEKGENKPVSKILVLEKSQVKTIEILQKSFILTKQIGRTHE